MGRPCREPRIVACPICETPFESKRGPWDKRPEYCSEECGNESTARKHLEKEVHHSGTSFHMRRAIEAKTAENDPTPEEIAEGCRQIQAGEVIVYDDYRPWSDEEYYRRAGLNLPSAEVTESRVMPTRERRNTET